MTQPSPPTIRRPTEGRTIGIVGDIYRFLTTGDETGDLYRDRCLRCNATGGFTIHERRRRGLRVISDLFVQVRRIIVIRWKRLGR